VRVVVPPQAGHEGRFTEAMSAFNASDFKLLDDHVLFDVLPDDMATPGQLGQVQTSLYDLVAGGDEAGIL